MARLVNTHSTLVALQEKVYKLGQELLMLKREKQALLNRITAAEAAAASAIASYQEVLAENQALKKAESRRNKTNHGQDNSGLADGT